jgi:predicted  nucleic acid-binding Zn-ribbon protein
MKTEVNDVVRLLIDLNDLEDGSAGPGRRTQEGRATDSAQVESLRGSLPSGVLNSHDQMRSRGKRSVAEVRHGVCSGCHLALAVGNAAALRRGDLRRCGNCGRFVYVVDEDEREAESTVPAKLKPRPKSSFSRSRLATNSTDPSA